MGSNTQDPYGPFPRMALNVRVFPLREVETPRGTFTLRRQEPV